MPEHLSRILLQWFDTNKRKLPWREDRTAYKVWLSEVILQQTRVQQGLPYYERIVKAFPDVYMLAKADEKELLNLWQGLGYYSRARNLHTAAKQVVNMYNGDFPKFYEDLIKLKGVGEYTAAAVASIVSDEAVPVVDGNVYRVLSRLFDIDIPVNTQNGKKVFRKIAEDLMDKKNPGKYNEAIMEFGALQCTVRPDCRICPLQDHCIAFKSDRVANRPVKIKPAERKMRYLHFLVLESDNHVLLTNRKEEDIWQGLYQPLLMETKKEEILPGATLLKKIGLKNIQIHYLCRYDHMLTHRHIIAFFYKGEINTTVDFAGGVWVPYEKIQEFPVPRLIEKFFDKKMTTR